MISLAASAWFFVIVNIRCAQKFNSSIVRPKFHKHLMDQFIYSEDKSCVSAILQIISSEKLQNVSKKLYWTAVEFSR